LTSTAFEQLHATAWMIATTLVPLSSNVRSAILYHELDDQHAAPVGPNFFNMDQEKMDFLARNMCNLRDISIWSPLEDRVSFAALTQLTKLRLDPAYGLPKSSVIRDQCFDLPTTLQALAVSYFHSLNGITLSSSLTPLVNLTELSWNASGLQFDDLTTFFSCLPLQLKRLMIVELLHPEQPLPPAPPTVHLNLPKLESLTLSSEDLASSGVIFTFFQAPRLRELHFYGGRPSTTSLLLSLASFPQSRDGAPTQGPLNFRAEVTSNGFFIL
jgi:hypothetical protein